MPGRPRAAGSVTAGSTSGPVRRSRRRSPRLATLLAGGQSTAARAQLALVLVFLAARCVHLAQMAVDLGLAGPSYTRYPPAVALGGACLLESTLLARGFLRSRRLTAAGLAGDALFGLAGMAVMSFATTGSPGRAAAVNWMLPYTVASSAGLGLLTGGARTDRPVAVRRSRPVWPLLLTVALTGGYVGSVLLPHRVAGEPLSQVVANAANYPVFFTAAALAAAFLSRVLAALAGRERQAAAAAAAVAHRAQWRAFAVDVFGPVRNLLDQLLESDGGCSAGMRREAHRLIELIESVRPLAPPGRLPVPRPAPVQPPPAPRPAGVAEPVPAGDRRCG